MLWKESQSDSFQGFGYNYAKRIFDFAISIQSCPEPSMRSEWEKYGNEAFEFQVLEELTKGASQTPQEFSADVKALLELWKEKEQ